MTGADGIAQVIYRVPERIAFNDVQHILIQARLVGTRFEWAAIQDGAARAATCGGADLPAVREPAPSSSTPRSGRRAAPTRSTPPSGCRARPPSDARSGTSGTSATGRQEDGKTEVDKAYTLAGTYTITHVCTDKQRRPDTLVAERDNRSLVRGDGVAFCGPEFLTIGVRDRSLLPRNSWPTTPASTSFENASRRSRAPASSRSSPRNFGRAASSARRSRSAVPASRNNRPTGRPG